MSRVRQFFATWPHAAAPRGAALIVLALLASGCSGIPPVEPRYPLVIPAAAGEGTTRLDHADILSATVEGNRLRLLVRFGGGCRPHHFSLVHDGLFMESFPVQTRVQLAHDAHGDMCRALLSRELDLDLTPLRDAYLNAYGTGGTLVIHLTAPGGGESPAAPLHYRF